VWRWPTHDSVATTAGAASIVKTAVDAFGRVDVLVNNAGILRDKSFLKMDEAMWDAVVAVHLKGTFLCSQVFAKQLVAQGGGGRIVNTTSVSGMLGNFGQANYSAAKAGIYGLTRTMSIELQKHRITVNAIAPIAKTRMTEDLPMFQGVDTLTPSTSRRRRSFSRAISAAIAPATCSRWRARASTPSRWSRRPGASRRRDNGVWTAQEIAESWDAIVKV
jgi:NAD(P)-dependent dehydrogenase (short-subunit alcohol dehydrogenase family)